MTQLMKIVLVLSLSGTVLAAFLALLRRWLKNRLPHWLFYYLWLLVLLRLLIPVALPVPGLELTLPEPRPVEAVTPPSGESTPPNPEQATVPFDPTYVQTFPSPTIITGTGLELSFQQEKTPWYEPVWDFLCKNFLHIWLTGAVIHFLWFALSYLHFCRSLKQDCVPLWEHEQALLDGLRGKLQVEACRSPLAGTPMLVGLIRPRIILPETAITTLQLECILRHELTHLRRRDLLYKWFAVAVTSFHWFNPLMPWLRKELDRCCELSCDEAVIGSMNEDWKHTYGETLLALAAQNALPRAVPATTLCEEKQQLKERLVGILKHRHATALILALSCLLALLVAGCAAVLGPSVQKNALPQAADYALWIQSPQQETFVRNWKAEYHDGTEVTSVHFAPEDYSGEDYVFRGRELPELRARVEAWAFAELPLDRENCILYYQMEPELLPAASSPVTEFPLDGGEPTQTEVFQLDMSTYCGHVTVTDLRDNSLWLVVLTDAGRAAELSQPVQPLTEEEQAAALEAVKAWAEQNVQTDAPPEVSCYTGLIDRPQRLGWLAQYAQNCWLYDLGSGEIRAVDGTYPDSARLGTVMVQGTAEGMNRLWGFYLTRGGRAAAPDPISGLEQLAADHPGAKASSMEWSLHREKGLYINLYIQDGDRCYCWEYSSICGRWGETLYEEGLDHAPTIPVETLPDLMTAVIGWQEKNAVEADRDSYTLALNTVILPRLERSGSVGEFLRNNWENVVVYDLNTGAVALQEGLYTGTAQYGHLTLLYPATECQQWVYVVGEIRDPVPAAPIPDLTERVAVLTQNAPLDNAFVRTVDAEGRTVVMDMAMALRKGDLVWVESQEGETCSVTALAGEPPRAQGQLNLSLLSVEQADLENANQVILQNAPQWSGPNEGTFAGLAVSGVANVEDRREGWYCVTLPGGDAVFWARQQDTVFEWPVADAGFHLAGKDFVYENPQMGFRMIFPASWEGQYLIEAFEDSVRIDDAWGATLCTVFPMDEAQFTAFGGEDSHPVPCRVLGQDERSVWLMYFASDVQYDPGNAEQTAAYLRMYEELQTVPFELIGSGQRTFENYDADGDGKLAAREFPRPTGDAMGLTGKEAALYTVLSENILDLAYPPEAAFGNALVLTSVKLIGEYAGENGQTHYVCGINDSHFYDAGDDPAALSYHTMGSQGLLARVTLSAKGELAAFYPTLQGIDNTQRAKEIFGPLSEQYAAWDAEEEIPGAHRLVPTGEELLELYKSVYFPTNK